MKLYGLFVSLVSTLFVVAILLERKCLSRGTEYFQVNKILFFVLFCKPATNVSEID